MAAATADDVKAALTRMLKVDEADLAGYWSGICSEAADYAYQEVLNHLLRRGFRLAEDILPWDRLYEFTLDLGLWKAIQRGGVYAGFDPDSLKALDRRDDLDAVLVFVAGEWVRPAAGQAGTVITGGPRAGDSGGVFDWDATDEADRGIRW